MTDALIILIMDDHTNELRAWRRISRFFSIVDRVRYIVGSEPNTCPNQGTTTSRRSSHGGNISPRLATFIALYIFEVHLWANRLHEFWEVGGGRAFQAFIVCALTPVWRFVGILEIDPIRNMRILDWIANLFEVLNEMPVICDPEATHPRHFKPILYAGDFLRCTPRWSEAIHTRPIMCFVNNERQCFLHDGTQTQLEHKLDDCRLGSVIVTFSRSFLGNSDWTEQVYIVHLQKKDLSWQGGNPEKVIPFKIYKYVKVAITGGSQQGVTPGGRATLDVNTEEVSFSAFSSYQDWGAPMYNN